MNESLSCDNEMRKATAVEIRNVLKEMFEIDNNQHF